MLANDATDGSRVSDHEPTVPVGRGVSLESCEERARRRRRDRGNVRGDRVAQVWRRRRSHRGRSRVAGVRRRHHAQCAEPARLPARSACSRRSSNRAPHPTGSTCTSPGGRRSGRSPPFRQSVRPSLPAEASSAPCWRAFLQTPRWRRERASASVRSIRIWVRDEVAQYDLVIGADGIQSAVRAATVSGCAEASLHRSGVLARRRAAASRNASCRDVCRWADQSGPGADLPG